MRLLFEIDKKDYNEEGSCCVRPSVRGIIVRDGKIAMVHSLKYDYYKFPGGGMEQGETQIETLIREVREETGLVVMKETIREYGMVHRIQKGTFEDIFVQDNYYYLCDVEERKEAQVLDDYEDEEEFTLEFVTPQHAIAVNKTGDHGTQTKLPQFVTMIEREIRVLDMLIEGK